MMADGPSTVAAPVPTSNTTVAHQQQLPVSKRWLGGYGRGWKGSCGGELANDRVATKVKSRRPCGCDGELVERASDWDGELADENIDICIVMCEHLEETFILIKLDEKLLNINLQFNK